ncbi:MAG: hypothetical protein ABIK46_05175 [candidate division WOR-3 bacterium]
MNKKIQRKKIAFRLNLNEWTVRNVFRQKVIKKVRKERKRFYPCSSRYQRYFG